VVRAKGVVVFQVHDSGAGIPGTRLAHVADALRNARARRPSSGLGLGLSIARHLVHAHGGSIEVESAGDGLGATFTVTLPLRSAPAKVAAPSLPRGPRLDDVHILVVEDDVDARLWLTGSLESLGAVVASASSVHEALETLERQPPHVLVSDIRLPDGDGYALLRRLRAVDATRGTSTPAIALTAYPRVEDRARALEAGFTTHVPKPVRPDELAAVVASVARREGGLP
jgi:CheY-like chemotaxis protein